MADDDATANSAGNSTDAMTRRRALLLIGAAPVTGLVRAQPSGAVAARESPRLLPAGPARPACVVRPRQTAGPYFLDTRLRRADLRTDPAGGPPKPGAPLRLTFRVSRLDGASCTPLPGAVVDVWQCDAHGVYSGFRDVNGFFATRGAQFLRGYQLTDTDGAAEFVTVVPGWYPGRAVHLHFMVRTDPGAARGRAFTSQIYFDDDLIDRIHAQPPYASRGPRDVRNAQDFLFQDGGRQLMLGLRPDGDGYAGTFDLGLEWA